MVARSARLAALAMTWLFVAAVVAQVFLAGLGLFADSGTWRLHVDVGWILHLAPILILLVVAVSRPPRQTLLLTVALAAVTFVLPLLATLRADAPVAAALHPVVAMLVFSLALMLALRLTAASRHAARDPAPAPSADTGTA